MKRTKILILITLFYYDVKSQDIITPLPDSGLKTLITGCREIVIPNKLKSYAGIRFIDVRYLKEFIGFVPSSNDKKLYKLKTRNTLEEELNKSNKEDKSDSASQVSDSIIVVIKNFWFNRNQSEKNEVYCHVAALFFIKKSKDVYYDYKVDTFFNYKDHLGEFYKASIDKAISDLMTSYSKPAEGLIKKYSTDEFNSNVQKKRTGPKNLTDSNGLFLTYNDFLNGVLYKTAFELNPFFDQFTFTIRDEALNVKLHKSIWGLMYKGNLYIRTENLLCRAFSAEGTYIARSYIEIHRARSGTYAPVYDDATNSSGANAAMSLGSAAIINLLQSKKARIKSNPVVLNIETGELE